MDLSQSTAENIEFMIEAIKTKLRMASGAAIKSEYFDAEKYEDLVDIYEHVNGKERFSVSEIDAIVQELGRLRK
ncbi:DUF1128 domain-containing protein [Gorillibacterium massiliense]|uniref:DUF1128 domain-containing protein n=1 Tax=Gorillibacterium massiliense TaxID=1280390 RepID=UPI0004B29B67|nr:DUF1128 domain-containing protein [Gorillibacterium massiliense]